MNVIIVLELLAAAVFVFIMYHVIKYRNPYKLIMVFGAKGSGKTTHMTKMGIKHLNKGWNVYCDRIIPGCELFQVEDFGKYKFPEKSVILIDEVGTLWDNRNFKSFPPHVRDYFKYQRQYKNKVYLYSQAFDIDKKIRDLTDHIYVLQNFFNFLSLGRRVTKKTVIVDAEDSPTGESKITESYKFDPFWTMAVTYIPKWAKFFNSFNPPELPDMPSTHMKELDTKKARRRRDAKAHAAERREILKRWNRSK